MRNLGLVDLSISVDSTCASTDVGGIAGKCDSGGFGDTPIIDNCFVDGETQYRGNAVRSYVGGLAGEVAGLLKMMVCRIATEELKLSWPLVREKTEATTAPLLAG